MRKFKVTFAIVLSMLLIIFSVTTFSASDSIEEYCGLDLDNFYLPILPSVNDAPASYTTLTRYDPRLQNATTPHLKIIS